MTCLNCVCFQEIPIIMTISLPTQSIILRDYLEKDLDTIKEWEIGHHKWMEFNGPYYPIDPPEKVEEHCLFLQQKIAKNDWPSPRRKMVIASKNNTDIMGTVSWYWQSKETNWLSIGLVIYSTENWGKGIGHQALKLWNQYLFNTNDSLVRLDLRTWSGNAGMVRLGEKLGYRVEARFRKARIVKGKYYDSIGMGLLKEEWITLPILLEQ